jgi:pimeloyl-ACP methyl ester carboxylesterase
VIRQGAGEPLVLLHGVMGSERMWRDVVPLLAPHHDTIAMTALGHRGGPSATAAVTIAGVVDDAERRLDELGLDRPHLAGNSMGGWVALELARRGRAQTVCALSPAGFWSPGGDGRRERTRRLRRVVRLTRAGRPLLPVAARSGLVRRQAMRDNAHHGERIAPSAMIDLADDLLGCSARDDLLDTTEHMEALDPLPCPVMLAWSARDRIFPPHVNGARAQQLLPGATYRELADVGHVPMLDDPALVAATILDSVRVASGSFRTAT